MSQERPSFGSIECWSRCFRARHVGPDRQRYDAPRTCSPTGSTLSDRSALSRSFTRLNNESSIVQS